MMYCCGVKPVGRLKLRPKVYGVQADGGSDFVPFELRVQVIVDEPYRTSNRSACETRILLVPTAGGPSSECGRMPSAAKGP